MLGGNKVTRPVIVFSAARHIAAGINLIWDHGIDEEEEEKEEKD